MSRHLAQFVADYGNDNIIVQDFKRRLPAPFKLSDAIEWSKIINNAFIHSTTVLSAVPKQQQDLLFKSVSTAIHNQSLSLIELQTEVSALRNELVAVKADLSAFKSNFQTLQEQISAGFAQTNSLLQRYSNTFDAMCTDQSQRNEGPRTRKRTSAQVSPMVNDCDRNVRHAAETTSNSSTSSPLPNGSPVGIAQHALQLSTSSMSVNSLQQASSSSHPGCVHVFQNLKELHFKDLIHVWISKNLTRDSTNWVVKNSDGDVCPQNKYKLLTVIEYLRKFVLPEQLETLKNPQSTPETVATLHEIQNKVNAAILDFKKRHASTSNTNAKVRSQFKPCVTAIYGILECMKAAGEFQHHSQVTRESPSKSGQIWDIYSFFNL